jgi:hypothetical protein
VVPGGVHQVPPTRAGLGLLGLHALHEGVAQPDREVEVHEPAACLRADEGLQVGMVRV